MEEIFYGKGCKLVEQLAQKDGGCSIPGSGNSKSRVIQGQAGKGSKQPYLDGEVAAHFRRTGQDDL